MPAFAPGESPGAAGSGSELLGDGDVGAGCAVGDAVTSDTLVAGKTMNKGPVDADGKKSVAAVVVDWTTPGTYALNLTKG